MWTDLECSAQLSICSVKALKKCICSKLPIFDLPFMFVLQIHPHPPPLPTTHTPLSYAHFSVSYTCSQKKFWDVHEFSNEKSKSEKRENN